MDISVIPYGNVKIIRLSKMILGKYNITHKVELILKEDQIILFQCVDLTELCQVKLQLPTASATATEN